jgi:hypothetical protein
MPGPVRALRAAASLLGPCTFFRGRKIDTRSACLRQADGNRLLRGSGAVLSLTYVLEFPTDEFSGLSRQRLALTLVSFRAFDRFLVRHAALLFIGGE